MPSRHRDERLCDDVFSSHFKCLPHHKAVDEAYRFPALLLASQNHDGTMNGSFRPIGMIRVVGMFWTRS